MKKIFALFTYLISVQAFSQSFYKGALVLDANVAIDAYSVDYKYQLKNTNLISEHKSGAASSNFNIGLEYGLTKWLGIGLRGKFDNYFTKRDSTTHSTPTAKGAEIAFILNAHLVKVDHFDLPIGIDLGYSHLDYFQNDVGNNQIYGSGGYFNFHINPRVYFKRFGFNLNIAVPIIHYANMTSNNSTFNQYVLADWKGTGFSMGLGIQYRFLNAR